MLHCVLKHKIVHVLNLYSIEYTNSGDTDFICSYTCIIWCVQNSSKHNHNHKREHIPMLKLFFHTVLSAKHYCNFTLSKPHALLSLGIFLSPLFLGLLDTGVQISIWLGIFFPISQQHNDWNIKPNKWIH